jgi:hypothetical protein
VASTHAHTGGSKEEFLKGFDGQGVREQIYLFQTKTNDPLLDNCLYRVAHEGADPSTVANYLENFPRFTSETDPVIIDKAVELGTAYRAQYVS